MEELSDKVLVLCDAVEELATALGDLSSEAEVMLSFECKDREPSTRIGVFRPTGVIKVTVGAEDSVEIHPK